MSAIDIFKWIKENCRINTPKLTKRNNIPYKLQKAGNSHTKRKNIKLWNTLDKIIKQKFNKTWIRPHLNEYINIYYTKINKEYCHKIKKRNESNIVTNKYIRKYKEQKRILLMIILLLFIINSNNGNIIYIIIMAPKNHSPTK